MALPPAWLNKETKRKADIRINTLSYNQLAKKIQEYFKKDVQHTVPGMALSIGVSRVLMQSLYCMSEDLRIQELMMKTFTQFEDMVLSQEKYKDTRNITLKYLTTLNYFPELELLKKQGQEQNQVIILPAKELKKVQPPNLTPLGREPGS